MAAAIFINKYNITPKVLRFSTKTFTKASPNPFPKGEGRALFVSTNYELIVYQCQLPSLIECTSRSLFNERISSVAKTVITK